ncbi:MAG TPA: RDD family protein [Solirubrobacteraceae bacterium]|jgi:uncharacterized RDD family membrane protein YckC
MTTFAALLGAASLWILYGWLASCILASFLSGRKGYGEKVGLASGMLLFVIGPVVWLVYPATSTSIWKNSPFAQARLDAPLAGWFPRVGATLIDGVVVSVVPGILALIGVLADVPALYLVAYVLLVLIGFFYAPVCLARKGAANGQTIGKEALGIRVVRDDGEAIDFSRAAIREMVGRSILGLIPLYSLVDVLWPLFDERNQALHDKLAKTTVRKA